MNKNKCFQFLFIESYSASMQVCILNTKYAMCAHLMCSRFANVNVCGNKFDKNIICRTKKSNNEIACLLLIKHHDGC